MNRLFTPALVAVLGLSGILSSMTAGAADDFDGFETMIAEGQAEVVADLMEDRVEEEAAPALAYYWLARAELAQINEASVLRKPFLARSARDNLQAAVAIDPGLAAAHEALARYYLEAPAITGGSLDKAVAQAELLVALDPPAGFRVNAAIAQSAENYPEAVDWLQQALAADWNWDDQYALAVRAVSWQTGNAAAVLDQAQDNVQAFASEPDARLALLDYQRGKLAATTGTHLEPGRAALLRYLESTPAEGEPDLEWAQFRLAQVERLLGLDAEADARLSRLEAAEVSEDLAFALNDERRWHYAD